MRASKTHDLVHFDLNSSPNPDNSTEMSEHEKKNVRAKSSNSPEKWSTNSMRPE